jgi:hypothetical protein
VGPLQRVDFFCGGFLFWATTIPRRGASLFFGSEGCRWVIGSPGAYLHIYLCRLSQNTVRWDEVTQSLSTCLLRLVRCSLYEGLGLPKGGSGVIGAIFGNFLECSFGLSASPRLFLWVWEPDSSYKHASSFSRAVKFLVQLQLLIIQTPFLFCDESSCGCANNLQTAT